MELPELTFRHNGNPVNLAIAKYGKDDGDDRNSVWFVKPKRETSENLGVCEYWCQPLNYPTERCRD